MSISHREPVPTFMLMAQLCFRKVCDSTCLAKERLAGEKPLLLCAGMNRHEAENERVSPERSSDPLGLESCVATARDPTKRRQRIGGVGVQLSNDAIRTPTSL